MAYYDDLSEKEKKKIEIQILYLQVYFMDKLIRDFFDLESDKLLDEKIQVLTDIMNGKKPSEIPNYYDILELYPKDGTFWD